MVLPTKENLRLPVLVALMLLGCIVPVTAAEKQVKKSPSSQGKESTMKNDVKIKPETLKQNVRREGGKVWIEGVKGFHAGEYQSSVHGAAARILQTLGESLAYDDLICYSGFAFRMGFHDKNCPSAGHPHCGYACVENGVRALPWNIKMFELHVNGKPRENLAEFKAEACAAVKASIDRGIPVHYGCEEDGLIIGYGDEAAKQLRIAANHYSQIAEECMKDINTSWDLTPHPNNFDKWTSEMRRRQVARLEAAREHDRAAIEAITKALAAEDAKVSEISSTESKRR